MLLLLFVALFINGADASKYLYAADTHHRSRDDSRGGPMAYREQTPLLLAVVRGAGEAV